MNDKLMPFRAGSNRSNPSFFPITHRFDRTHARPPSATLVPPKDFDVDIEAITRQPSRCPLSHSRRFDLLALGFVHAERLCVKAEPSAAP